VEIGTGRLWSYISSLSHEEPVNQAILSMQVFVDNIDFAKELE
jgi:hypothetical protein